MVTTSRHRSGMAIKVTVTATVMFIHAQRAVAQAQKDPPDIRWKDHHFASDKVKAALPEKLMRPAVRPDQPTYYFVQFKGPIKQAAKAQVTATGAELMNYVPMHAYIARMDADTSKRVEALESVRWTGPYHPGFRISKRLRETLEGVRQPRAPKGPVLRPEKPAPAPAPAPFQRMNLSVHVFPGEQLPMVQRRLERLGARVLQTSTNKYGDRLLVSCPEASVLGLTGVSGIRWIEEYKMHQLHNDTSRGIMNVSPVWTTHGLQGTGQIVGVADSGLDSGVNDATMHEDFAGRVINVFSWPVGFFFDVFNDGADDGASDLGGGHGTHVCGSVLGNGTASGSAFAGAAPQASIVMQAVEQYTDVGNPDTNGYLLTGIPVDLNDLFQQAYDAGARVHTNSWGSDDAGNYDMESQEVDEFVWDNPDMLILFSAGNAGEDADGNGIVDLGSVGTPGTAKNCITVGASENNRPAIPQTHGAGYGPTIDTDRIADDPTGMASFSSRGPANEDTPSTLDDRIKPDLVCPGTMVASVRTQFSPNQIWFEDDMESGVNGWTPTDNWAQVTTDAASPPTSWHDSPGGNYAPGDDSWVTSPVIDLSTGPGLANKSIRFKARWEMGGGDVWRLELSKDDGASWIGATFGGVQANWELIALNLRQVKTWANSANLLVRFRLIANTDGSVGDGLYVDDFSIVEGAFGSSLLSDHGLEAAGSPIDTNYMLNNGTSMATPLAAGAATLVRQYYTDTIGLGYVSAALIRATLINGAFDMDPGQYGTGSSREIPAAPNNVEGWGRLDLEPALFPAPPAQLDHVDEQIGLVTGETNTYYLEVSDDSVPAAVTMVYHDYPGAALVNNLDLTITPPGGLDPLFPNGLTGADGQNNTERIVIPSPVVGTYTITVTGQNVPEGPQPYALVTRAGGSLIDRDPMDAMLVLDMSGSMLSPACPTCDPKLDVLKDSVELFIQLYRVFAIPGDRLGIHYFRTNVTGGTLLLPVIANADAIIADVRDQGTTSSAMTAMGGGIQSAIETLSDPARTRGIIVFTDGMQNVNPMVIETDTSPPPDAFELRIDDEPGRTDSNISAASPPTQLDSMLGISINTIGVGAMPAFQDLLDDISQKTGGVTKMTTAPDDDLRQFFVEELIDVLRGFSPQLVDYRKGTLEADDDAEPFQINANAKKIVLKLSWKRGDAMDFKIKKDGLGVTEFGEITEGPFYRIFTLNLPAQVSGETITSEGAWTMYVGGPTGRPYEVACIVDEPVLEFECQVAGAPAQAGEPLYLSARATLDGQVVQAEVKAVVKRPSVSIATLLATMGTPAQHRDLSPEPGASRAQVKLERLLLDREFQDKLEPVVTEVPLERRPDGSYLAKIDDTRVSGSYTVEFQIEGGHDELGRLMRTETRSRFVSIAPPNAKDSGLYASRMKKTVDGQAYSLHIAPKDRFGNMLGPDASDRIKVMVRPGDVDADCVQDLGDGSYLVPLFVPGEREAEIEVRVGGHVVFEGKLSPIVR